MKTQDKVQASVAMFADALGKSLVAGLAGTVAITISQIIEMKITEREPSTTPAKAVEKTLEVAPAKQSNEKEFSQKIHWVYGISWGAARGILGLLGIKKWAATAVHYTAVTTTAFVMLPALKVAPPLKKWGAKEISIELFHHAVYAIVAGLVYDAIDEDGW
ncbi:MAG TPA: hypothetical protein VL093_03515 [Flavipsychrobacter sp.]|nr:hypothetical protein [Flavipsychrobacter sp.]